MKIKLLAAILLLAVVFSGCSDVAAGNTDIMRPPRATGDKAGIQELIEVQAGGKYVYKYPQAGEYRSAITMKDIDGDGVQEAIAIFKPNTERGEINVMFLKENNGVWTSLACYSNNNNEVKQIMFADLNGNGNLEILIGFNNYSTTANQLILYFLKDNSMESLAISKPYNELLIDDFTGSGMDEIMLLSLSGQDSKGVAQLVKCDENKKDYIAVNTYMDPDIVSYSKITYGVITPKTNEHDEVYGVVVDGVRTNGNLSTEIIYWDSDDNRLRSTYNILDGSYSTERTTQTVSKDINEDGVLEIPFVRLMEKEKNEPDDIICNEIEWMMYVADSNTFVKTLDTVVNYSDGYYFIMPVAWQGNVTARYEATSKTMSFYEWKKNKIGELLLILQTYSVKEWEDDVDISAFIEIGYAKNTVYTAYINPSNSPLIMEDAELLQNFTLISNN